MNGRILFACRLSEWIKSFDASFKNTYINACYVEVRENVFQSYMKVEVQPTRCFIKIC